MRACNAAVLGRRPLASISSIITLRRLATSSSKLPYRIRAPLSRLQQQKATDPQPTFRTGSLGDGEALESDDMAPDYLSLALRSRVYDLLQESPLQHAPALSESLGAAIHLKREDTLPTFSFYVRCAVNELAGLRTGTSRGGGPPGQRELRLVTGSVGSRGVALAWAAERMGHSLSVVVPTTTPQERREAIARRGAEVILHGESLDEAQAEALRLGVEGGYTYVGSHDAPAVIAAAGTVGLEVLRQHGAATAEARRVMAHGRGGGAGALAMGSGDEMHGTPTLDAVFVGVAGGSLLAGVAATLKALSPHTKIIAVEPHAPADVLSRSLLTGYRLEGASPDGKAGIFVSKIGPEVFRICDALIDDIVTGQQIAAPPGRNF